MRLAAIFPGQGSQSVGMGADIAARSEAARELFRRAEAVLGYDLFALMQDGPDERLRETQYSQPAIFVTNLALFEAAKNDIVPVASAGHSFGEFCSLTIAGSIDFDSALRIVDERGKAMQAAAEEAAGGMSAVLGLEAAAIRNVVEKIIAQSGARLQLANFNSPTQIVISGDIDAVRSAGDELLEAGAKRVVPLNVSGAWHSDLMKPAIERFARAVTAAEFAVPRFTVVSNVDAKPYESQAQIKENLVRSITHEVRWHETSVRLLQERPDLVVEFGANAVLGPLMRRLPDAPSVLNVSDSGGVEKLRAKAAGDKANV